MVYVLFVLLVLVLVLVLLLFFLIEVDNLAYADIANNAHALFINIYLIESIDKFLYYYYIKYD